MRAFLFTLRHCVPQRHLVAAKARRGGVLALHDQLDANITRHNYSGSKSCILAAQGKVVAGISFDARGIDLKAGARLVGAPQGGDSYRMEEALRRKIGRMTPSIVAPAQAGAQFSQEHP